MNRKNLSIAIILLILAIATVVVFQGLWVPNRSIPKTVESPSDASTPSVLNHTPFGIHINLIDTDPLAISFIWVTLSPTNASILEVTFDNGTVVRLAGVQREYKGVYWHRVILTGLVPGEAFSYRVGDPELSMSDEFKVKLPDNEGPLTFTVYGDQGINKYSRMAVSTALSFNPAFNFHVGDLSYGGANVDIWLKWFSIIEPLAATRPYIVAVGNHEYDGEGDLSDINIYIGSPDESFNYWFVWSNAFFLVINLGPEDDAVLSTDIYNWVRDSLGYASRLDVVKWKFVFLHYPPYSSGVAHGSAPITESLMELFDEYGVDIVFAGHEHNYERTYPIYNGAVVSRNDSLYINPGGTIYVVVGGAGGGLYKDFIEPQPEWSFYREARYSIGVVEIRGDTLVFKAVDSQTGEVFDEFIIIKKD